MIRLPIGIVLFLASRLLMVGWLLVSAPFMYPYCRRRNIDYFAFNAALLTGHNARPEDFRRNRPNELMQVVELLRYYGALDAQARGMSELDVFHRLGAAGDAMAAFKEGRPTAVKLMSDLFHEHDAAPDEYSREAARQLLREIHDELLEQGRSAASDGAFYVPYDGENSIQHPYYVPEAFPPLDGYTPPRSLLVQEYGHEQAQRMGRPQVDINELLLDYARRFGPPPTG